MSADFSLIPELLLLLSPPGGPLEIEEVPAVCPEGSKEDGEGWKLLDKSVPN